MPSTTNGEKTKAVQSITNQKYTEGAGTTRDSIGLNETFPSTDDGINPEKVCEYTNTDLGPPKLVASCNHLAVIW